MFRLHTQLALPILLAKILCILLMTGCNQNPFSTSRTGPNWNRNAPEQPPHVTQLAELDRRNRSLDSNNSDLHSRVAQAEQEKQLLQKRLKQAQQLLDETAGDLEAAMADNEDAKKEIEGLYASTKHRGWSDNSRQQQPDEPAGIGRHRPRQGDSGRRHYSDSASGGRAFSSRDN